MTKETCDRLFDESLWSSQYTSTTRNRVRPCRRDHNHAVLVLLLTSHMPPVLVCIVRRGTQTDMRSLLVDSIRHGHGGTHAHSPPEATQRGVASRGSATCCVVALMQTMRAECCPGALYVVHDYNEDCNDCWYVKLVTKRERSNQRGRREPRVV